MGIIPFHTRFNKFKMSRKVGEIVVVDDVYDSDAILHNYQEAECCTEEILVQVVEHHYISRDEASNIFNDVLLHDKCIFEKPLDDKTIRDMMWNNLFSVFMEHVGQIVSEEQDRRQRGVIK